MNRRRDSAAMKRHRYRDDGEFHARWLAAMAQDLAAQKENAEWVMQGVDQLPKRLRDQVDELGPEAHAANRVICGEPEIEVPIFPYMRRA